MLTLWALDTSPLHVDLRYGTAAGAHLDQAIGQTDAARRAIAIWMTLPVPFTRRLMSLLLLDTMSCVPTSRSPDSVGLLSPEGSLRR